MALPAPPSHAEIVSSGFGTWRLFIGDSTALSYFGSGSAGFWRACWALAAVLPLSVILYLLRPDGTITVGGLLGWSVAIVIAWYGFALAVHYVVPVIDRDERYFDYMIAEYWSSVPALVVQVVALALAVSGLFSEAVSNAINVAAFGATLWLRAQVIRIALDVNWGMTIGLVIAYLMFEGVVLTLFARGV